MAGQGRAHQRENRPNPRRRAARLAGAVALAALALVALPGAAGAQPAANSAHEMTFWTGARPGREPHRRPARRLRGHGGRRVRDADGVPDRRVDRRPERQLEPGGEIRPAATDPRLADSPACRGARDRPLSRLLRRQRHATTRPRTPTGSTTRAGRAQPRRWAASPGPRACSASGESRSTRSSTAGQARWTWNYPGNTHTEAEVRAKAKQRGRQAMTAILDGFPGVEIGIYNFMQKDSWNRIHLRKDRQPPLPRRAEYRHVRSARGHRLLGRDDVGRGLLGDPPVELRVRQALAARDRPREHAQVGERDASGRLEHRRAPLEGVRELGLRRSALPLLTVRLDQRRSPRVAL